MAQYDVYPTGNKGTLLLDVQTDLVEGLNTRVVVPLLLASIGPQKIKRLHPVFQIDGQDYMMATQLMSAVPKTQLGQVKTNLLQRHDDIVKAVYMIVQGF